MMPWWRDRSVVSKTPIVTVILLENGNLQQVIRMWREGTAEGQSLWGWISVNLALLLWCNFYRVCCPNERTAFWATILGVVMNAIVIGTVVYFRYGRSS